MKLLFSLADRFGPLKFGLGLLSVLLGVALLASCAKPAPLGPPPEDHAPHGGTLVEFANGVYHLELVLDPGEGRITAYLMDSELETYIRAGTPSFELVAKVGEQDQTLVFKPVANIATGETLASTAQYEATAEWLRTTKEFDAELKNPVVLGTPYPGVKFNFPKGNDNG